jgi:hypothetical protein
MGEIDLRAHRRLQNTPTPNPNPNKSIKIPTFFYTKHWHTAPVTDAASLCGGSVSNRQRLSEHI